MVMALRGKESLLALILNQNKPEIIIQGGEEKKCNEKENSVC
jgi:hypothetical protein